MFKITVYEKDSQDYYNDVVDILIEDNLLFLFTHKTNNLSKWEWCIPLSSVTAIHKQEIKEKPSLVTV